MSQNDRTEFVNIETWNLFRKRFRSETTEASYRSDIGEFCRIVGKTVRRGGAGRCSQILRIYDSCGNIREDQYDHKNEKVPRASFLCFIFK